MPKQNNKTSPALLTVQGFLKAMSPAKNRPGCVLELTNGRDTGLYYVPLSPHDCRARFPEQTHIRFTVWESAIPDACGVIDTAGDAGHLWEVT